MIDAETRAACKAHVGKERVTEDSLAPEPVGRLAIVLGTSLDQNTLPPTWHWAYFNGAIPQDRLGYDYHEETGLFLPAAPFPRRMWAAGDVRVQKPLRIGTSARQRSRISDVSFKEGRSGALCFVTVEMEITQAGETCIQERRTIVYRDRGAPEQAIRQEGDPVPDGYFTHPASQLFFYSAITHNGHRIHWDRDFCRDTEGYPDLVVHGPLMATELCDAMRGNAGTGRYIYRALAPVFVTTPVKIQPGAAATERKGRILRSDGVISMEAIWKAD